MGHGREEELRRLYAEYERVLALQRFRPEDLDGSRLAAHLPFLERLDAIEDSSVALFDLQRQRYAFLTGSFRFLLGYDREEALEQGPPYFYRRMHPEDLPLVLDTVTRCFRFLHGRPRAERKDYKLGFDFRIRRADGALDPAAAAGGRAGAGPAGQHLAGPGGQRPDTRGLARGAGHPPAAPPAATAGISCSRPEGTAAEATGGPGHASEPPGDRDSRPGGGGPGLPRDRRPAVHQRGHRQQPPPAHPVEKTGAKNSSEAVRYASRLGIV